MTVIRKTNDSDAADIADTQQWVGLRSAVEYVEGEWVYGYTTLLFIRMRASQGVSQAARDRVRVKARRLLEDDTVDSSNPVEVVRDIWTSRRYGLARNESTMDIAALDQLALDWAAGPKFNGTFDQRGTGWDACQAVCSMAGANFVQDGSLVTIIPDRVKDVRTAMFSSANIVPGSAEITYTFDTDAEYDGVRIEYRDDKFQPAYVYYPNDEIETPDTHSLFGCTDETYALQFATYMYNVKARRRKEVTFVTEMEGLLPIFGDRIAVSIPFQSYTQSGMFVEQIDTTTWRTDQPLDWENENIMVLRDDYGVPYRSVSRSRWVLRLTLWCLQLTQ